MPSVPSLPNGLKDALPHSSTVNDRGTLKRPGRCHGHNKRDHANLISPV
jgi:hypothetical protein